MEADRESQSSINESALGFRPGASVAGRPSIPRSKSIAQRQLLCAALAEATTHLTGLDGSEDPEDPEDVRAAISLLQGIGVGASFTASGLRVQGGDRKWPASGGRLELGESGTLARFATAVAALCPPAGSTLDLVPSGSLSKRSSPALFACLRAAGARLELADGTPTDGWPVRITSVPEASELTLENPSSSQEVSALLIALASRSVPTSLEVRGEIPSRPYLDLTLAVLAEYGVAIDESDGVFRVLGPLVSPGTVCIEPDASAAGVALAAGCLSGGAVEIEGLGFDSNSRQGDVRIVELLSAAGCVAERDASSLRARGAPDRMFDLDLASAPDLAPVLAAVAAYVAWHAPKDSAGSRLRGLETLPGKESSRIEVLARGLSALGFEVRFDEATLEVARGTAPERDAKEPIVLNPESDHRMAFCFGLCSLFVPGVFVSQPECTGKSWPTFWTDLAESGARLESTG